MCSQVTLLGRLSSGEGYANVIYRLLFSTYMILWCSFHPNKVITQMPNDIFFKILEAARFLTARKGLIKESYLASHIYGNLMLTS